MSNDSLGDYLRQIARYPLLTPSEEIELSRLILQRQELKALDRKLTKAEQHAIKRGDRAAQRMINSNLRLVVSVARQAHRARKCRSLEMLDLISHGNLGLAIAVERFDYSRGYKFSTYAYWWIRQGISRGIHSEDRMIRLPQHTCESEAKLRRALAKMAANGEKVDLAAAAKEAGLDVAIARRILELQAVHSLNAPAPGLDDVVLLDIIADENIHEEEPIVIGETKMVVEDLLELLDARQRDVITHFYGLHGHPAKSMAEIATQLGVSRERVRQIRDVAERRMRVLYCHGAQRSALWSRTA